MLCSHRFNVLSNVRAQWQYCSSVRQRATGAFNECHLLTRWITARQLELIDMQRKRSYISIWNGKINKFSNLLEGFKFQSIIFDMHHAAAACFCLLQRWLVDDDYSRWYAIKLSFNDPHVYLNSRISSYRRNNIFVFFMGFSRAFIKIVDGDSHTDPF